MRKLFLAVLVLVSVQVFGQNPTNYLLRNTRERLISGMYDSMFRIPRYNGTPSGVRVSETSAIDGAIAMDTTNHRMYIFSGNAWVRLANYSEVGSSYSAGYGLTLTSTTFKADSATLAAYFLRRKDSATGTNLNGYLTRSSLPTYYPTWQQTLDVTDGSLMTHNNIIDLNGRYINFQSQPSSDLTQFKVSDGDIFGYTESVSGGTTSAIESNQDISQIYVTHAGDYSSIQSVKGGAGGSTNLTATMSIHPLSSLNWGVNVDRNYHGVKMGIATDINSSNFKGIWIDSTRQVLFDSVYHTPRTDLKVILWDSTGKKIYSRPLSAFSGGSTSPAGNYGNLQINRNGSFDTPASDSLGYTASGGLNVKNVITANAGTATRSVVTVDGTQTLTNKRWTARVGSTTSSATPTINTDNVDIYKITALAAAITSFSSGLSGTPVDGDILEIQITDDGTARAITWGASFVSTSVTLPATTTISTTLTVILQYYTTSSYGNNKWGCVNYY